MGWRGGSGGSKFSQRGEEGIGARFALGIEREKRRQGGEEREAREDEAAEVGQNQGELCGECRGVGADLCGDG